MLTPKAPVAFSSQLEKFDGELGASDRVSMDNIGSNYQPDPDTGVDVSFFSLLALFYPSVTGIMAGSNR